MTPVATDRLSAFLDRYLVDPGFAWMTEEEVMAFACELVNEVRQERKYRQFVGSHLFQPKKM